MNKPKRCINQTAREVCGAKILDDDEDAIQIDIGYICGVCLNKILYYKPSSDLDSRGRVNPFKQSRTIGIKSRNQRAA